jgi:hypothetical protein
VALRPASGGHHREVTPEFQDPCFADRQWLTRRGRLLDDHTSTTDACAGSDLRESAKRFASALATQVRHHTGLSRRDCRSDDCRIVVEVALHDRRGDRLVTCRKHRRERVDGRGHAKLPKRGLSDALEDRRGHDAAGIAAAVRRVDDDDDRQRRLS